MHPVGTSLGVLDLRPLKTADFDGFPGRAGSLETQLSTDRLITPAVEKGYTFDTLSIHPCPDGLGVLAGPPAAGFGVRWPPMQAARRYPSAQGGHSITMPADPSPEECRSSTILISALFEPPRGGRRGDWNVEVRRVRRTQGSTLQPMPGIGIP